MWVQTSSETDFTRCKDWDELCRMFLHVSQTVTYSVCYICIGSCDVAAVIAWVSYGSSVGCHMAETEWHMV